MIDEILVTASRDYTVSKLRVYDVVTVFWVNDVVAVVIYLIELKQKDSAEKMDKVINQLNEYETLVQQILPALEKEFEKEFFYPIHFKAIKKMVIAPREFFKGKKYLLEDDTIEYGHFRDKDITDRQPKQMINIHLEK